MSEMNRDVEKVEETEARKVLDPKAYVEALVRRFFVQDDVLEQKTAELALLGIVHMRDVESDLFNEVMECLEKSPWLKDEDRDRLGVLLRLGSSYAPKRTGTGADAEAMSSKLSFKLGSTPRFRFGAKPPKKPAPKTDAAVQTEPFESPRLRIVTVAPAAESHTMELKPGIRSVTSFSTSSKLWVPFTPRPKWFDGYSEIGGRAVLATDVNVAAARGAPDVVIQGLVCRWAGWRGTPVHGEMIKRVLEDGDIFVWGVKGWGVVEGYYDRENRKVFPLFGDDPEWRRILCAVAFCDKRKLNMPKINLRAIGPASDLVSVRHAWNGLRSLSLVMDDGDITSLSESLLQTPMLSLRFLNLCDCKMGESGMMHLAEALRRGATPALEILVARTTGIIDTGVAALGRAIQSGNLSILRYLSVGRIGPAGCVALSKGIRTSGLSNLQLLDLYGNKIGCEGCIALCDAFTHGGVRSLRGLWLVRCELDDTGCMALAECMMTGTLESLLDLRISSNEISSVGFQALAEAFAVGSTPLLKYFLAGNNIQNDTGVIALVEAARSGNLSNLKRLEVGSSFQIGAASITALSQGLIDGIFPSLRWLDVFIGRRRETFGSVVSKITSICEEKGIDFRV